LKKLFPLLLLLSLIVVGCESKDEKLRRACATFWASGRDTPEQEKAINDIRELNGVTARFFSIPQFCKSYRGS
jgi:hypothetical protein|tara:strand:- start:424 stop:642 length:219 start_codon:yes stop_codon:yes gene_type:complete